MIVSSGKIVADDIVTFISEDDLSSLSMEVLDRADNISDIFSKLDNCMSNLPNHYKGDACTEIMNKYKELSTYYSVVKENIVSYSDDLITLIKKLRENDRYSTTLFQSLKDDTDAMRKSVNIEGGN